MQFNNSILSKIYLVTAVSFLQFCTSPTVKDTTTNTTDTTNNINKQSNTVANTLASYTWSDAACEYTGNYNPQTYSPELIKNTHELFSIYEGLLLENRPSVYKPSDLAKLNLKALTAEYTEKKALLEKLKIIDAPFWNTLKKQTLQQLDEEYEFDKLQIQAFDNPEVLLNNRYSKDCERYVTALNSTDTSVLFATWKSFAEELKAKNGSPEAFMARFNEKYNSPEKLIYAKIDLITFGWGNCANNSTFHVLNDGSAENAFKKLFTNVKQECEEP